MYTQKNNASTSSIFSRPLRLGGHSMPRRKSDATSPPAHAAPDEPLPPVPSLSLASTLARKTSLEAQGRAVPINIPTSPSSQASHGVSDQLRSPSFRVLPPISNTAPYSHSKNPSWATPSAYSQEVRDLDLPQEAPPIFTQRTDATERRRLQTELRIKPLHQSTYGQAIVQLLTVPWVVAPSGLAACVLPQSKEAVLAADVASYINLLVCGAEAFASPYADILAVHQLGHLNKWLMKSGLSPIAPGPLPQPWAPLAARQPPDFLLEGFKMRSYASSHELDPHA